ncbi:MAG TPA: glycosyltransferase family 9 protein [Ignavibacteriales bacterium]|nr:glycosyltransferase family 9 protein [Ignavibacteriales bacterium]
MKKVEIFIKNIFLKILLLLKAGNLSKEKPEFNEGSKILFIRLNRIGDALVTTPLLKEVKRQLKCKVHVLADKNNSFIFTNNPYVDKVVVFRKGFKGFFETLDYIKKENFDAIVDLHDDVSTTVTYLLAMAKAPNKFGLRKGNEEVYTRTVTKPDPRTVHVVDRVMALGELLNVEICKREINVNYQLQSIRKVEKIIEGKFPDGKFILGINISAGSQARFWGVQKYRELIRFLKAYNIHVLLLCSEKELPQALEINEGVEDNIFHSPSFDEFASAIAMLDMLFTPDTMAVHLASVWNIPVFGIYVHYNTTDMIWTPYGSDFDGVITENNTLNDVTVKEVVDKLKPFLEKYIQ